jgi:hypothetical protein
MKHETVAGALFDFLGFLTIQPHPVTLSKQHEVHEVVDLLKQWAKNRNLNLDNANADSWEQDLAD